MWLLCGCWGVPLDLRISPPLSRSYLPEAHRRRGDGHAQDSGGKGGITVRARQQADLFLPTSALVWTRLEVPAKSGTHVLAAAVLQGELRLAAERPVLSWGGLTSLIVPRVQLLDPQLVQGLGELQLLPGHVVPEQHHVLGADVTLRTDDRENVLQRYLRADTHHGLLRPQVVHYQAHGLLGEHTDTETAMSAPAHSASAAVCTGSGLARLGAACVVSTNPVVMRENVQENNSPSDSD